MRVSLALLATVPLLAVGSAATAGASSSVPPRNGLIAVYGGEGLHLVDPAAGSTAAVPETADALDAAWSPDGTRLAMTLWGVEGLAPGVYTMKPDGSERTLVIREGSSPTWSPDGKWLAVVHEDYSELGDGGSRLVVVGVDGKEERVLVPGAGTAPAFISTPAWSPDGKLIAFVGGDSRIELVTPDGERQGGFDVAVSGSLSWSPDSSQLAFDSSRELKTAWRHVVVVLDVATGKETLLLGEQDGAQGPAWSPEGDQIAFLSMRLRATEPPMTGHSCGGEPYETHLWSMRPDGTKAHRLVEAELYGRPNWGRAAESAPAPAPAADQEPAPAPVAEQEPAPAADVPPEIPKTSGTPAATSEPAPAPVAKTTETPVSTKGLVAVRGSNAIYLVNPNTAAAHKVPDTADMIAPAWSPDGSLLAVERVAKDGSSSSIYTIKPDGTEPQLVLANASAPTWSAGGERIFVVRDECSMRCEHEDDEARVRYSVRPDGSDLQRVDLEQELNDPRELAWRGDGSPIWFFEDGSADGPGTFDTAEAAWAPDETRIAFIGALGPTDDEASADTITAGLWIVSAEGGTPQLLLKGASGWPSWPS